MRKGRGTNRDLSRNLLPGPLCREVSRFESPPWKGFPMPSVKHSASARPINTPTRPRSWSPDSWLVTPSAAWLTDISDRQAAYLLRSRQNMLATRTRKAGATRAIVRKRMVQGPNHARVIERHLDATTRDLLPCWQPGAPIAHEPIPDSAWRDSEGRPLISTGGSKYFVETIVPAYLALHEEARQRYKVSAETFARVVRVELAYGDYSNGRNVIVRPDTVASILGIKTRTVQRCRAFARYGQLLVDLFNGRMLTLKERRQAHAAGSRQRGLANVSAYAIPHDLAQQLAQPGQPERFARHRRGDFKHQQAAISCGACHPSQEAHLSLSNIVYPSPSHAPRRQQDGAPRRHQRTRRPKFSARTVRLAQQIIDNTLFLRRSSIARILPTLSRYANSPHPWTAAQLQHALYLVNRRCGYSSPLKAKTEPWRLLAWYLGQIDPIADHPHYKPHHETGF